MTRDNQIQEFELGGGFRQTIPVGDSESDIHDYIETESSLLLLRSDGVERINSKGSSTFVNV